MTQIGTCLSSRQSKISSILICRMKCLTADYNQHNYTILCNYIIAGTTVFLKIQTKLKSDVPHSNQIQRTSWIHSSKSLIFWKFVQVSRKTFPRPTLQLDTLVPYLRTVYLIRGIPKFPRKCLAVLYVLLAEYTVMARWLAEMRGCDVGKVAPKQRKTFGCVAYIQGATAWVQINRVEKLFTLPSVAHMHIHCSRWLFELR